MWFYVNLLNYFLVDILEKTIFNIKLFISLSHEHLQYVVSQYSRADYRI